MSNSDVGRRCEGFSVRGDGFEDDGVLYTRGRSRNVIGLTGVLGS